MLKTEMIDKLNEQMNLELYSSLLYQQMSAWCSYHSFEGAAAFMRRHAQEEMTHMQRLCDYLTDTDYPGGIALCRVCIAGRTVPRHIRA